MSSNAMIHMVYITSMHLDLNLLTAFDVLLEEGSVNGAAERLHLSQPAMSRTLGRIREATGDAILVRTGRNMSPTPYALSVREEVHTLVQQARAVLAPTRDLNLKTLERTFTLRCHDAVTNAIGASLLGRIQAQAPGARLRLLAEESTDTNDLRHGQVDLEVGSSSPTVPELHHEMVDQDRLAVAVRADHAWTRGTFTVKRFAEGQHVIVSRRGRMRDPIDTVLEARGMQRQVIAAFSTSTAALQFVGESESAVVVPKHMCSGIVRALELKLLSIPINLDPVPLVLTWHQRYDGDKAHQWIRKEVRYVLQSVCHVVGKAE